MRAPSMLSAVPTAGTRGVADGCWTIERYIFGQPADMAQPTTLPVGAAGPDLATARSGRERALSRVQPGSAPC